MTQCFPQDMFQACQYQDDKCLLHTDKNWVIQLSLLFCLVSFTSKLHHACTTVLQGKHCDMHDVSDFEVDCDFTLHPTLHFCSPLIHFTPMFTVIYGRKMYSQVYFLERVKVFLLCHSQDQRVLSRWCFFLYIFKILLMLSSLSPAVISEAADLTANRRQTGDELWKCICFFVQAFLFIYSTEIQTLSK